MMAASVEDFNSWLDSKLHSIGVDESILSPYIISILEGEEAISEKFDAVKNILCEFCGGGKEDVCQEILDCWTSTLKNPAMCKEKPKLDFENQFQQLMKLQAKCTITEKKISDEGQDLKQAILAQYGEVSDEPEDDSELVDHSSDISSTGCPQMMYGASHVPLVRNTNAELVARAEKEKREKSKQEAVKKKEQDKINREKQKQVQQDRKEKEKKRTQKGERRR